MVRELIGFLEVLLEFVPGHVECAIIVLVVVIVLVPEGCRPLFGLEGPLALPDGLAPGVPHFHHCFVIDFEELKE